MYTKCIFLFVCLLFWDYTCIITTNKYVGLKQKYF